MKSASRAMQLTACFFLPILLFTACHGDGSTGVADTGSPGLHAVLGAGVTDTVDAQLKQALVVEVRTPDGQVAPGVAVRFETPHVVTPGQSFGTEFTRVCAITTVSCGAYSVVDTTDSRGRASAIVRLGTRPGISWVNLSVPVLGLVDSASYTITPGAPARVVAAMADTMVDLGATITLSDHVTDRFYNVRSDVPTISLGTGSSLTLDAAKSTVTGTSMGTQWAYAKYASFVDSTSVRVVPPGRLLVWSTSTFDVRLVNTNGTNLVTLANSMSTAFGVFPHFDASRQHVTLLAGTGGYNGPSTNIVVVDTSTLVRQDLGSMLDFTTIIAERQQADGSLLVVGLRPSASGYSLWKVTMDGTITSVVSLPSMGTFYDGADISRDGTRVAYIATPVSGGTELRVLDVASGNYTALATAVLSPRFSPQADRVAFLVPTSQSSGSPGTASVIDINGANRKSLGSFIFSPGLAWSPDGVYVIGRNSGPTGGPGLRMLRVSDGANVLLRFRTPLMAEDYYQPDWR